MLAPGNAKKIAVSVPYVYRISDYLQNERYQKLQALIEPRWKKITNNIKIPRNVLGAELDVVVHFRLLDIKNNTVGFIQYQTNHSGYSPRSVRYDPQLLDPAKVHGRMSQVYVDIHQEAINNNQLIKNDVVSDKYSILTIRRLHPKAGRPYEKKIYNEPYKKNTVTTVDLVESFVRHCINKTENTEADRYVSSFESQKLTVELFGAIYEGVAKNYLGVNSEMIVNLPRK